jgi:hypothetical protein
MCGENGGKVGSKSALGWITEVGASVNSPVVGVPGSVGSGSRLNADSGKF